MRSRIAKVVTIAALAAGLAACSSVSLDDQAGKSGADGSGVLDPFNPQSILAKQRSVYFDYNSYTVSDQYRSLVDTHGKYLVSAPQQRVVIEGNTDARGGSEYNLALGQRRAEAVREPHATVGEAVDVGRLHVLRAVTAQGIGPEIVAEDEEDVRPRRGLRGERP